MTEPMTLAEIEEIIPLYQREVDDARLRYGEDETSWPGIQQRYAQFLREDIARADKLARCA